MKPTTPFPSTAFRGWNSVAHHMVDDDAAEAPLMPSQVGNEMTGTISISCTAVPLSLHTIPHSIRSLSFAPPTVFSLFSQSSALDALSLIHFDTKPSRKDEQSLISPPLVVPFHQYSQSLDPAPTWSAPTPSRSSSASSFSVSYLHWPLRRTKVILRLVAIKQCDSSPPVR